MVRPKQWQSICVVVNQMCFSFSVVRPGEYFVCASCGAMIIMHRVLLDLVDPTGTPVMAIKSVGQSLPEYSHSEPLPLTPIHLSSSGPECAPDPSALVALPKTAAIYLGADPYSIVGSSKLTYYSSWLYYCGSSPRSGEDCGILWVRQCCCAIFLVVVVLVYGPVVTLARVV